MIMVMGQLLRSLYIVWVQALVMTGPNLSLRGA
jgi:hypothetical protein